MYVGGVGEGKSNTAIADCVAKHSKLITNIEIYNHPSKFLTRKDFIKEVDDPDKKDKKKYEVNYDFWEKLKKKEPNFDVVLDEIHQIVSSSDFFSKDNKIMRNWVSQVRKVLSGNKLHDLIGTLQRPRSLDKGWRDLVHEWILCKADILPLTTKTVMYNKKVLSMPIVIIKRFGFSEFADLERYMQTGDKSILRNCAKQYKPVIANDQYQYYDTFAYTKHGEDYL
jgi:hypothetical protein